jgi:putative oxidoreductase
MAINSAASTTTSAPPASGHVGRPRGSIVGSLGGGVRIVSWIAQVIAAVILLQTLFFKFTGAPESVYIFKTMGMEPWGRYASGVAELIAAILLLIPKPRLNAVGAVMAMGVILGAIGSHLTKLGITIPNAHADGSVITGAGAGNDGGLLFILACVVLVCGGVVAWLRRAALLELIRLVLSRR